MDTRQTRQQPQNTKVLLPQIHSNGSMNRPKSSLANHQNSSMDESILIQPEFQKMEITNGGRMDTGINTIFGTTSSHRRRRNSSNSRPDISPPINLNGRYVKLEFHH